MRFIMVFVVLLPVIFSSSVLASIDPGYEAVKKSNENSNCPSIGEVGDRWLFVTCNCTSYVAYKINQMLVNHSPTNPMFDNYFHSYSTTFKWSHAYHWEDAIGVAVDGHFSRYPETLPTSAPSYPWKTASDGTVYDVRRAIAWWNITSKPDKGHVAWVENVHSDGVTIDISQYNGAGDLQYSTQTLSPGSGYPDGFLYIFTATFQECDLTNLCPNSGGSSGGGGGSSNQVNLVVDFDIMHLDGHELFAGQVSLYPGSQVDLRVQVEAENDDAWNWRDPGKEQAEVDFYVQLGSGAAWTRVYRDYMSIANLTKGHVSQETYRYTIPSGVSQVSFKVKIDAEDEVSESNEGDNWSRIETFQVSLPAPSAVTVPQWLVPMINFIMQTKN